MTYSLKNTAMALMLLSCSTYIIADSYTGDETGSRSPEPELQLGPELRGPAVVPVDATTLGAVPTWRFMSERKACALIVHGQDAGWMNASDPCVSRH